MTEVKINTFLTQAIEDNLKQLDKSIDDLLSPPFKVEEATEFLTAVIQVVNELVTEGTEEEKLLLIMDIWDYYDEQYKLIKGLDDSIDFKKLLGSGVGTIVEQFDDKFARLLVEKVIIPVIVKKVY